jgi:7-carboxy-7-deazaguanine synthase
LSYAVKEIFLTLQGEGAQAGRAAVFCRFSGCNLWSGREQDRATATCRFCDTDFVGTDGTLGGRSAGARELADTIAAQWAGVGNRYRFIWDRVQQAGRVTRASVHRDTCYESCTHYGPRP